MKYIFSFLLLLFSLSLTYGNITDFLSLQRYYLSEEKDKTVFLNSTIIGETGVSHPAIGLYTHKVETPISTKIRRNFIKALQMYNTKGLLVKKIRKNSIIGTNNFTINTKNLSMGFYAIKLTFRNKTSNKALTVTK